MERRPHSLIPILALLLGALITASSCRRTTIMHTYRNTPVQGWEQSDRLAFRLDTVRESGLYAMRLGVRTTADYPYQKLWLVMETDLSHPDTTYSDTIVCTFVRSDGTREGSGTDTYQYNFDFADIMLHEGQTGRFVIHHIMQREILQGISDIGIRITRKDDAL